MCCCYARKNFSIFAGAAVWHGKYCTVHGAAIFTAVKVNYLQRPKFLAQIELIFLVPLSVKIEIERRLKITIVSIQLVFPFSINIIFKIGKSLLETKISGLEVGKGTLWLIPVIPSQRIPCQNVATYFANIRKPFPNPKPRFFKTTTKLTASGQKEPRLFYPRTGLWENMEGITFFSVPEELLS
jgi:hypothetical protein